MPLSPLECGTGGGGTPPGTSRFGMGLGGRPRLDSANLPGAHNREQELPSVCCVIDYIAYKVSDFKTHVKSSLPCRRHRCGPVPCQSPSCKVKTNLNSTLNKRP